MTLAEQREKLRLELAKAAWRLDCVIAEEDYRRERRQLPDKWADPWHESGCGVRQQKQYFEAADNSIAAISAAGFSIVADEAFDAFELAKVDIARKPE